MRVIYSHGTNVGAKGHAHIAWGICDGLQRAGVLHRVLCLDHVQTSLDENRIQHVAPLGSYLEKALLAPGRLLPSLRFSSYRWKDNVYDRLAARKLEDAEIFYGWSHHSLRTLRAARDRGMRAVVECPTSHVLTQKRIVLEECERLGVPAATQTHPGFIEKSCREFEESDAIVVASSFAAQSMREHGVPEGKIIQAHYGYDATRYYPPDEPPPPLPFRVVFLGMVGLRKGAIYLLEAWKKLRLKDAELVFGGWVDAEIRSFLEPYRDLPGVRFPGYVDPGPLLRRSHLFVLPTLEDGFATVVTEAMACGVPCIVTENTGAKDAVRDGEDGYVIPVRDVDALMERIGELYENRQRLEQLRQAALRNVQAWGWERRGEIVSRSFETLMESE